MNKLFHFVFLFFCFICFVSCGQDVIIPTEEEEEYVEVGLVPKGVDVYISPMATKASSTDIYYVEVYRGGDDEEAPYAAWTTSDLSSGKFKLVKGDKYSFYVMYFPNGQNILEGVGYPPLYGHNWIVPSLTDGICYGDKYHNTSSISGTAKRKGEKGTGLNQGHYFNDIDRYHGVTRVEATASVTLDVNLYKQMFGLKIVANNFTEGTIHITPPMDGGTGNNAIDIKPDNPTFYRVMELESMPFHGYYPASGITDEYIKNFECPIEFNIDYIGADGEMLTILNFNRIVKRMTNVNITLDMKEILEDIQAGLTPHVVSDEDWNDVTIEY